MRSILIYTKDDCPFCTRAKNLLAEKGMAYQESKVGVGILREEFMSIFPDIKSLPLIIINGQKIGGYSELCQYINEEGSKQFLTE